MFCFCPLQFDLDIGIPGVFESGFQYQEGIIRLDVLKVAARDNRGLARIKSFPYPDTGIIRDYAYPSGRGTGFRGLYEAFTDTGTDTGFH